MTKINWEAVGSKVYETGVKNGVLYKKGSQGYGVGVPWNGLTAVNEAPSGAEPTTLYADDKVYANLMSAEKFGGTIEAYTYPDEFEECDGSKDVAPGVTIGQQDRCEFGFVYTTGVGNDVDGVNHAYNIHIVYGALASPSAKNRTTVNETPEAMTFSWTFTTTPVEVAGFKPTAHIVINSKKCTAEKLALLEKKLYGTDEPNGDPTLPTPAEIISIVGAAVAG